MSSNDLDKQTPMMAQWHNCKNLSKNALLFFRLGDFYEAFHEDALLAAKELGLTLTRRQDIPMCGVPAHTCDSYIDKLVAKGYRVAVAEQVGGEASSSKGLMKREIARVVSPGTLVNSALLTENANNFFVSLAQVGAVFGLAYLDLTTSEFRAIEFESEQELTNEICRLKPAELLVSEKFKEKQHRLLEEVQKSCSCMLTIQEEWRFEHQLTCGFLVGHFRLHSLDGFGLRGKVAAINASGALLAYLKDQLSIPVAHIDELKLYSTSHYMSLDRITQRNLELTEPLNQGSRKNTLIALLDRTSTPMGGRLMHHWIKQPLISATGIQQRQDAIQGLILNRKALEQLSALLDQVRDLERLIMKIGSGYATPRDLCAFGFSLKPIPALKSLLRSFHDPLILQEESSLEALPEVVQLISQAIVDEPPVRLGEGRVFREGYCKELDELVAISQDSKAWIASYQAELKEKTGIRSLKVGYTKMFGYYIEVSKGQAEKIPDSFQRRQTLVNGERYITPELKEYENKVVTAEERVARIESELFQALRIEVSKFASLVKKTAQALARIDCLHSLAKVAVERGYVRPCIDESHTLQIIEGRHPVIEAVNQGEIFIPNDTFLDNGNLRMYMITGPNMAGKSTYLRQVALIVIMAQIGSFVPVKIAHIGVVDKVFTRIGASDDLTRGQSTFMVEMTETANILHHATDRSLVILDEIGRGTSTYDGISIAWAIAEFLLTTSGKMAKTLFATHYWELTKIEEKIPGAVNYNVVVQEHEDQIIFLRKIVKGGTDKSYGIHVARLAGLPSIVISRAKEILIHLEENANRKNLFEPPENKKLKKVSKVREEVPSKEVQLLLFEPPPRV